MSRPRPPKLQDPIKGRVPEGISERDRAAVIAWAVEWSGLKPVEPLERLMVAVALMDTQSRLKRAEWSAEAEVVARIATRRLHFCGQVDRARRTKHVLPGILFGTHVDPCAAAAAKDGTVSLRAPDLPLARCDAAQCRCYIRQISKAEYDERSGKK